MGLSGDTKHEKNHVVKLEFTTPSDLCAGSAWRPEGKCLKESLNTASSGVSYHIITIINKKEIRN